MRNTAQTANVGASTKIRVDYTKESAVILVTTAGKVGGEASRLLAERGEPVRVLVRDPTKAPVLQQAGIEVAIGDLAVPGTLDQALQDVTAVILVSPAVPAQEIAVIEAAARAGASHVVKVTSKASADSPIARRRGQAAIEAALTASGLGILGRPARSFEQFATEYATAFTA